MQFAPPIFEHHIGLLKSIVSSFDRLCPPEDSEFFPVACIGMIKAISTFDPSKSKFSYWATKIIKNAILGEIKAEKVKSFPLLGLEDRPDEFGCDTPLDLIPFLVEDCDDDTSVEKENKRMLLRHYLDGVPMAEIARETGFSRERIRQKVNKAIDLIRRRHVEVLENHPFA